MGETMKKSRQSKIVELVTTGEIGTQEELADRLNAEGFKVTQATVSRDIRELKLSKVNVRGNRQKYVLNATDTSGLSEKYQRALQDGLVSVTRAMNMLVVRTIPGMAMAVAAALDALNFPEILGSIAGDDTIMCATPGEEEAKVALEMIRGLTTE